MLAMATMFERSQRSLTWPDAVPFDPYNNHQRQVNSPTSLVRTLQIGRRAPLSRSHSWHKDSLWDQEEALQKTARTRYTEMSCTCEPCIVTWHLSAVSPIQNGVKMLTKSCDTLAQVWKPNATDSLNCPPAPSLFRYCSLWPWLALLLPQAG